MNKIIHIEALPGRRFTLVPEHGDICAGCKFDFNDDDCLATAGVSCVTRHKVFKEVGVDYGKGARRYGDPIIKGKRYMHYGSERCPVPEGYCLVVFFGGASCGTPEQAQRKGGVRWTWTSDGAGGDITSYIVCNSWEEAVARSEKSADEFWPLGSL